MKKTVKQAGFVLFHLLVAAYSLFLMLASVQGLFAQSQSRSPEITSYRVDSLEGRLTTLESLKLDQRLVRIETILSVLEDRSWVTNISTGGVGLLLARAVFLAVRKRSAE